MWWFDEVLSFTTQATTAAIISARPGIPQIRPIKPGLALGLKVLTTVATLLGRRTRLLDRLYYGHAVQWLAKGFAMSRDRHDPVTH